MGGKVVFVLVDAIGFDAAVACLGTLEGLVEGGKARRWRMRTVLPSLSAPVYETLHTGTPPHVHGIRSNDLVPLSRGPHVFGVARAAGRGTAAVAHWNFAQMYNGPYDAQRDIEVDDESLPIQHGRFYGDEHHTRANLHLPSEHDLMAKATLLIRRHAPDYLLLHAYGPDSVGHVYGGASTEYRHELWAVDNALADFAPLWLEAGYRVILTSDHGMTPDGRHGGTSDVERIVPFYEIGHPEGGAAEGVVSQLAVAPTSLARMGLKAPAEMSEAALP